MIESIRRAVVDPVVAFARGAPTPGQLWAGRRNDLDAYHAILPSTAGAGESLRFTLQAWDRCERLVRDHDATVTVRTTDPAATAPDRVSFPARADGIVRGNVRFDTPGLHYLTVEDPGAGLRATSNPVVVTEGPPERRVYWGDIHLHSQFSDGAGSMATGFAFGRDVMDLDVVAYTDHDTMGFFIPPTVQRWLMAYRNVASIKREAERHHDPGSFVTLYGYEWTKQPGAGGHVNCYFDDPDGAPFFHSRHPECRTYEGLWRRLRAWREEGDGDVVTIPHHPAEAMYPFDFSATDYDDELAPLVEVYSQWGSSESPADTDNPRPIGGIGQGEVGTEGHYLRDALDLGHRVGIVAGSDYHGPRPGHSLVHAPPHVPRLAEWRRDGLGWGKIWRVMDEDSYPGGLTAFDAPELTRDAVFGSLRDRRVYGTTQPHRILVRFGVNGTRLRDGDPEATVPDRAAARTVRCWVAGSAPIERVDVVRRGRVWRTLPGDDEGDESLATLDDPPDAPDEFADHALGGTVTDTDPLGGADPDRPEDYYYLRARQADGGLAWAGPIWVDTEGED